MRMPMTPAANILTHTPSYMIQTFNSIANFCNRNASVEVSNELLAKAYVGAVGGSVVTALSFNKFIASNPKLAASPVGRFVPLMAVAAANCINIPMMRQQEQVLEHRRFPPPNNDPTMVPPSRESHQSP